MIVNTRYRPLSSAQQRLWFLSRLNPDDTAYNLTTGVRLRGPLNRAALERALHHVCLRHEVLRTRFVWVENAPVQIVESEAQLTLESIDLTPFAAPEREQRLATLSQNDAASRFELARLPLIRALLVVLEPGDHVLLVTIHHIVGDAWSMGILVREVAALYEAFSLERASPLQPLPLQYADFADWQREWLGGEAVQRQLAYWKEQLKDPPPSRLPADYSSDAPSSGAAATLSLHLSEKFSHELRELGRREHATLFMVMLAAMAVLISRVTEQDDIVLGSPIANRTRRDLEPLIGCFVNTLALRMDLSGASTFRDALTRARDTCVGAYKNQEVPFDLLVKSLNLDRDLDRNPLFQVWFAMQNAPAASVDLGPVRVSHFPRRTEACRFDLEWNVWDSGGPLKIGLTYRADLFAASTAQRLLSGYETVLNEFAGDPTATTGTKHAFRIGRRTLSEASPEVYATKTYQAPQTPLESMLARIWADVLNVNAAIGRNDNFFELGGHSLLAVTVVERMRSLGLAIDIRTLFAQPTIASLCMHLDSAGGTSGSADAQPAEPPLLQLSDEDLSRIMATVPGGAVNFQDVYPLTPTQDGILFHHLLNPDADPYRLSVHLRCKDRESLDAYLAALQAVVDRHDMLRTAIVWEGVSEPVQVVWRHAPIRVETAPSGSRMNLGEAPLIRVLVVCDGDGPGWIVQQQIHHLAGDQAALETIQEEISAHLRGDGLTLPAPAPFREFVARTRRGTDPNEQERFFHRLLGDVDEPTAPFGLLHTTGEAGIREHRRAVDPALAHRLRDHAGKLGVGAACLFHVAWARVLAVLSGRSDVVFGSVMSAQGVGSRRMIGPFVNTLPVRVKVDRTAVVDCVRAMHLLLADLLQHASASLAMVQRCSRVPAPAPLFSAWFNYRYVPLRRQGAALGLDAISVLHVEDGTDFPLTFCVDDYGDGFDLLARVAPGIDPARVCDYVHTALSALADSLEHGPGSPFCSLTVLGGSERRDVLSAWSGSPASLPCDTCVHELIERVAASTPSRTALLWGQERMTYGELNLRSNRLARHLQLLGVKPDERVVICLERGFEQMVAVLAVMKAGGAYVPLDPANPEDRMMLVARESGSAVVVTNTSRRDLFEYAVMPRPVVDIAETHLWSELPGDNPISGVEAHNLAYIIYTSGSSGVPKGVMVEHRSLSNFVSWTAGAYYGESGGGSPTVLSIGFDGSVPSLFGSLVSGQTLTLLPKGTEVPFIASRCGTEEPPFSLIVVTPSHLKLLNDELPLTICRAPTQALMIGGERLMPADVALWRQRFPGVRLTNAYGPTEATVASCAFDIPACPNHEPSIPIGRPVAGARVYILDCNLDPLPIGVAGELYLGGVGVARGYLNQPVSTAERFVPDPFANDSTRMYRTGDLGRWRDDGTIEFLGRNDSQVKVRGMRIELGEVAALLAGDERVGQAIVVARRDNSSAQCLVAYYTGTQGLEATPDELRKELARKLPDYMVPSAFVRIDRLPVSFHGKLDESALPPPGPDAYGLRSEDTPRTPVEAILCNLWKEVLAVDSIGVDCSFFNLGGHSLLATRLVSRIRAVFQVDFSVRDLFEEPTVAKMADSILRLQTQEADPDMLAQLSADIARLPAGEVADLLQRYE